MIPGIPLGRLLPTHEIVRIVLRQRERLGKRYPDGFAAKVTEAAQAAAQKAMIAAIEAEEGKQNLS